MSEMGGRRGEREESEEVSVRRQKTSEGGGRRRLMEEAEDV
jgi:hypothetical protein